MHQGIKDDVPSGVIRHVERPETPEFLEHGACGLELELGARKKASERASDSFNK